MNANQGNAGAQLATIKPVDGSVLPVGELMERIVAAGDLSQLAAEDRARYLVRLCEGVGLNPMSQPFDLISDKSGKLKPYLNKSGTDQFRRLYRLKTTLRSARELNGVYMVEVEVTDGVRSESNIGAVSIKGLQGEALQSALVKAHTKAKRRATLDWCGLGPLDGANVRRRALGPRRPATSPVRTPTSQPRRSAMASRTQSSWILGIGELPEAPAFGQEIKAHLIATGRLHPDTPETCRA